jgi:hypothetical protein
MTLVGSVIPTVQLPICDRSIRFIAATGAITANSTMSSFIRDYPARQRRDNLDYGEPLFFQDLFLRCELRQRDEFHTSAIGRSWIAVPDFPKHDRLPCI